MSLQQRPLRQSYPRRFDRFTAPTSPYARDERENLDAAAEPAGPYFPAISYGPGYRPGRHETRAAGTFAGLDGRPIHFVVSGPGEHAP